MRDVQLTEIGIRNGPKDILARLSKYAEKDSTISAAEKSARELTKSNALDDMIYSMSVQFSRWLWNTAQEMSRCRQIFLIYIMLGYVCQPGE